MALKLLYIIVCVQVIVFAQAEKGKWGKRDVSYEIQGQHKHKGKPDFAISKPTDVITKPVMAAYTYLFSEVDGDRCPFNPSCSSFLKEGLKKTNIVSAFFLAADRLTRDTNPAKSIRLYRYDYLYHRLQDPFDDYIEGEFRF